MLEAVIANDVRVISKSLQKDIVIKERFFPFLENPSINTQGEFFQKYAGATANISAGDIGTVTDGLTPVHMPISNLFMLDMGATSSGFMSLSIHASTLAIVTEDSFRGLRFFHEDSSGVIWAVSNTSGSYGLWKRTGAGAWSQVLSEASAGQVLCRWTNGALYYRAGAGNWYVLAAGAATVSANPDTGATYPNWWTYANDKEKRYVPGFHVTGGQVGGYSSGKGYSEKSTSAAYDEAKDFYHLWSWPARQRICTLSTQLGLSNQSDGLVKHQHALPIVGLPNHILQMLWRITPNGTNAPSNAFLTMALINRTSGLAQTFDTLTIPGVGNNFDTAGNATSFVFGSHPRMATWTDGVLRLIYPGRHMQSYGGLMVEDYTVTLRV